MSFEEFDQSQCHVEGWKRCPEATRKKNGRKAISGGCKATTLPRQGKSGWMALAFRNSATAKEEGEQNK